jgi:surfeit locus 1 family protein
VGRIARHRRALRGLAGAAVATLVAFALLVGLGVWQLERLSWKEDLLARIAAGEASPPVPLSDAPAPFSKVSVAGDLQDVGYYGVSVEMTSSGPQEGAFRLGTVTRPGARTVLVNEGWSPDGVPLDTAARPATVVGYVLPPQAPGWFTPRGDARDKRFFAADPGSIGAALDLPNLAPFVVVALGRVPPGTYPMPADHLPQPPNNHLQYALTWFALAAALLVVFISYAVRRPATP